MNLFTKHYKVWLNSVATLAIIAFLVGCGSSPVQKKTASLLVIFTSGDVKISRTAGEVPAKIGMLVKASDTIKTGKEGAVDLQTRSGSAIRIKSNTTLTVDEISMGSKGANRMSLKTGDIMAKVKRQSAGEKFSISTPTAIAGVRGTSFTVSVNKDGRKPRVKVLNGRVAMAPRLPALEKISAEELAKNPELRKLSDFQKSEVVLDEKTEGSLSGKAEESLVKANEALSTKGANAKLETGLSARDGLKSGKAKIDAQDKLDEATLVSLKKSDFDRMASSENPENDPALKDLNDLRDAKQAEMVNQLRQESALRRLNTERERKLYYNKVATIELKDGKRLSGSILSRSGSSVVIHTAAGIKTVKRSEIKAIR